VVKIGEARNFVFVEYDAFFILLLNQITLFLLNVRNFIYVFVEPMIFVVIVMYSYYALLKRRENACDEFLFLNFS